jgi:hypothetical protein
MSHEAKVEQTTASTADHSVLTAEDLESVSGGGSIILAGPDVLLPPIIVCPPGPTDPIVVVDGPTLGDG